MSRVTIAVNLKNNGETVFSTHSSTKSKIYEVLRSKKIPEWNSGSVRVTYNKKSNYFNEADFTTKVELKHFLSVDDMLDPFLVKRFGRG